MSHSVIRGQPTEAQLYLDSIIDEVLLEQDVKPTVENRKNVSATQLLFHCLKRKPKATFMINGATGEVITNEFILKKSVILSRALIAAGAKGKYVMLIMRNHQEAMVVFFATLFAGTLPYLMNPNATVYELTHFLNLIEPAYIFHDEEFHDLLVSALNHTELKPKSFVVDKNPEQLNEFTKSFNDDMESYLVPRAKPDDVALLIPTSGSTGLPKAAEIMQKGTVIQMPTIWANHKKFPSPTSLAMILTTMQGGGFSFSLAACVVYHVPLLLTPLLNTASNIQALLEKFRPTFAFLSPVSSNALFTFLSPSYFSSLDTLLLAGAPTTPDLMRLIKDKLPKHTLLSDCYGCTEVNGLISFPDGKPPYNNTGRVVNCMRYKIVDNHGKALGPYQKGELLVKGDSVIKGYHKNEAATQGMCTPDGWCKTGDEFYVDDHERLHFVSRLKFTFKNGGYQVSPEEVESFIYKIPGIHEVVVSGTDKGPTAVVIKLPGADVTEEQIKKAVSDSLSKYKHLDGGVYFVDSLPRTHADKLDRLATVKLIETIRNGQS